MSARNELLSCSIHHTFGGGVVRTASLTGTDAKEKRIDGGKADSDQ